MTTNNLNIEASVAVIQEQLSNIAADMKEAREARKAQYGQAEQQNITLLKIEHRLEKVESFVAGASPTLLEFNALKLKAQGAGAFGKFLWLLAGVTISAAAAVVTYYQKFFTGH